MKAAVKQSAMPATATNQDFTDSVFGSDVKAALFAFTSGITSNSISEQGALSLGAIDDAANQGSMSAHDSDNIGTASDIRVELSSTLAATLANAVSNDSSAEATGSILSNGVRLGWTDIDAQQLINALVLGGSDVEASVKFATLNGMVDVPVAHGLSAAPHVIICFSSGVSASASGHFRGSVGFYDVGGAVYRTVATRHDHGVATTAQSQTISTNSIAMQPANTTSDWKATLNEIGATTFDVVADAATTDVLMFLSLRIVSGEVKVGDFLTNTTTGTQADISGMGKKPKAEICLFTYLASTDALDTFVSSNTCESFGVGFAADNEGVTEQASACFWADDGVGLGAGSTDTKSLTSGNKTAAIINTVGGLGVDFSVSSWDSGGITHNYSTVSGTARRVVYLALAPSGLDPIRLVWRQ